MAGAVQFMSDLWRLFVCVTVGIYGILTIFWFSLFFSNLVVPITVDYSPEWHYPPHLTSSPLLHNLLLLSLFPIQHSTMPRETVKKVLRYFVPEHYYTTFYVVLSGIVLNTLFLCWQPMPAIVWETSLPALEKTLVGLNMLSWVGVVMSIAYLDPLGESFGILNPLLSVLPSQLQRRILKYSEHKLVTTGMFGVVRHPIYTTIMMGMWITPIMTVGHLLIATILTVYIVLAVVYYEEPDLVRKFGSDYLKYKETVPAFFPVPSLFRQSTKNA